VISFEVQFTENGSQIRTGMRMGEKLRTGPDCVKMLHRAFYAPRPDVPCEIIIEPKCHSGQLIRNHCHVIEMMMQMDFRGRKVLDMCGTASLPFLHVRWALRKSDAIDNK